MPSRRFIATAFTVTIVALAVFLYATRPSSPPSAIPLGRADLRNEALTSTSAYPVTPAQAGVHKPTCPDFTPRPTAQNGPGWRTFSDHDLCLTAEYPEGWIVDVSPGGVSFHEPTGHEGEYFETAFMGELSAEVHVRFAAAPAEPERRSPIVREHDTPMHAHIASYDALLVDGTYATLSAHAPENDTARQAIAREILRSIELQEAVGTLRLSAYVP